MSITGKLKKKLTKMALENTVYDSLSKAGEKAVEKLKEAARQSPERQKLWRILMVVNDLEHNLDRDPQYVQWLFLDKNSRFVAASWVNKFKEAILGGEEGDEGKDDKNNNDGN